MLNQYAMDIPTLPVKLCLCHFIQFLVECQAVLWECRAAKMNRQIFGTRGISGKRFFANPTASSSAPYPQELNPWSSHLQFTHHQGGRMRIKHQIKIRDANLDRQPEIQSSPVREIFQRIIEQTNNDCRFQIFISTNSPHHQRLLVKTRFKTEVCTRSQFLTEAMQWIKEVEMVDSVDDLKSSSSIRGISMPNFEVFDARIASALNKIIHNSHFKRKISLEEQEAQKQDRFLRGKQIAFLIYEYFRDTGVNDSVENNADLFSLSVFEMTIFRNSTQSGTEFYCV